MSQYPKTRVYMSTTYALRTKCTPNIHTRTHAILKLPDFYQIATMGPFFTLTYTQGPTMQYN